MSPPEGNCNNKKRISCTTVYHCLPSGRKVYPSKMYLLRRIFTIFVCQRVWIQPAVFRIQILPVRKTLISNVLWLLYDFLSLKDDANVPSKSNKQKIFFVGVLVTDEKNRIQSRIQIHQSEVWIRGSDPYQNVKDPEHCHYVLHFYFEKR